MFERLELALGTGDGVVDAGTAEGCVNLLEVCTQTDTHALTHLT
jgi:hypothetical protein